MLQISPLNAIWLITLGLCGLFVSLYNIDWHRHAQVKCNGLQINMLMAAAVCAVIASNLGMFVVMGRKHGPVRGVPHQQQQRGQTVVCAGASLALCCWRLLAGCCGQRYGTLDLRLLDMRMQQLPLGSDIWLLGVIGFGLLAGLFRCTAGCRRHHANASAPAAALFFYGSHEIGLLGILTLSLPGR